MKYVITSKKPLFKSMGIRTLAVDFDGTIVEVNQGTSVSDWNLHKDPETGKTAVEGLKEFKDAGWTIIIYTCRPVDDYPEIEEFLVQHNVPFDFINENPLQLQTNTGKLYSDVTLDDKAVTFKDWGSAFKDVVEHRKCLDDQRPPDKRVLKSRF
jgi:hydroxymethylpyrimidine pyrophosphatase-like HAD family hydrolase